MDFEKYFDRVYSNYDRYLIIPAVLLVLAVGVLGFNYATQGHFLAKGMDFTGGTEVTYAVQGDFDTTNIERIFMEAGRQDVNAIREVSGNETRLIVQIPPPELTQEEAEQILEDEGYKVEVRSFRALSAAVSGAFFKQAQLAFVLAFMIMSLVIFIAFKDVTPSLAVIFAAAGDIVFAAAGMSVLGIPLTLGSLAGLLMLIGYSVDTDIVLSTRVLKRRRGSMKERIWSSVKTGTTMSAGGIAGFIILYFASRAIVGPSELSNIAAVMVLGLVADMPFTWFGNAIILKKYVEGDFDKYAEVLPWR